MRTNRSLLHCGQSVLAERTGILLLGAILGVAGGACSGGTIQGGNGGNGGGKGGGGATGAGGGGTGISLDAGRPDVQLGDPAKCGNGVQDPGETCDDGQKGAQPGCSKLCQAADGYDCSNFGHPCIYTVKCGDGVLSTVEACDDKNTQSGDGCSADCSKVEDGWQCRVPGHACVPLCGDSKITATEGCDDGNTTSGDGCSSTCQVEPGWDCPTLGQPCTKSVCGNGIVEKNELCDCGTDATKLPSGCASVNGLFYGDGKGCSKTCTKEPSCRDSSGHNTACVAACGDGNQDPSEECDDGNLVNGDGCSSTCKNEQGFLCEAKTFQDSTTCASGTGQCLELPIVYRDFQPENVTSGGHPDFYFLGTKAGSSASPTTICVPNSGGPAKGNDSTARCWDITAADLLNGKPQYNSARANNQCACQFSDWNIGNSAHIPAGYTQIGNDSPLSDGKGGYLGGTAGTAVTVTNPSGSVSGILTGYTASTPGGPIFKGMVPIVKDAKSFGQWFNDDSTVNKTFTGVLEMPSIGTNLYQYASKTHLAGADSGFFPLDKLNPTQATLCNLWPYWNKGSGAPIWATCTGDQYFFPPRVVQADCPNQNPLSNGCWVTATPGVKHDSYFTTEARYYFAYDGATGITLQFFGDDDLFIFINGKLVLDLGGVHQQLPGKVVVTGDPGSATIIEGGCLDTAGDLPTPSAATYLAGGCSPTNGKPPAPVSPDDFRTRTVALGLNTGKIYEIAIFGADRHPPESNYQLTLSGYTTKKSICTPRCGDGIASAGEECDCGDGTVPLPANCLGANNDTLYGGCTTQCKFGAYCGDGNTDSPNEQCDDGSKNGTSTSAGACTLGCTKTHYCGDGIVDTAGANPEECDLGAGNGPLPALCDTNCKFPIL